VNYLDLYCERLGPGIFAEPLNALSNAAFIAVAWLAWRSARSAGPLSGHMRALLGLTVAIGVGSALFHTFATPWARAADELPIALFQVLFLWVYGRRMRGFRPPTAAVVIAGYLGGVVYCRQFPQLVNGSLVYLPATLMTTALGWDHWRHRRPGPFLLAAAAVTLLLAVSLRTLDAPLCERFPSGTHFLWHLLVAAAIYFCLCALLARGQPNSGPSDGEGSTACDVTLEGAQDVLQPGPRK
jgi:predicted membrane channel-forming protein YqfA (hemolysin III family)